MLDLRMRHLVGIHCSFLLLVMISGLKLLPVATIIFGMCLNTLTVAVRFLT